MLLRRGGDTVVLVHGRALRVAGAALGVALLVLLAWVGSMWWQSRLPDSYNVMSYGSLDYGGGQQVAHATHGGSGGTSVTELTGPRTG